jgi:methylphosphotriester-DNA--protein-cysteine methyltransferase
VVFFASVASAVRNGFRPCKRCYPNILLYETPLLKDAAKQLEGYLVGLELKRKLLDMESN